jgi:hypothetical protein
VADSEPVREPGDTPLDFSSALAPKEKKSRQKRGPNKRRAIKLTRQDIYSSLYTLGGTLNGLVKSIPRRAEVAYNWADDALDEEELQAFIEALTLSLETNQRAIAVLERVGKVTPHVALLNVSLIIVLRRLSRRKLISEDVVNGLTADNQAPRPMAAGGAHGDSWVNRNGKDDAPITDISTSPVYAGAQE